MTDNERKELLLKAKPILFNTEMVRAILDGRKTVTRRVIKPQPLSRLAYIFGGHGYGKWGYPDKAAYKHWGEEFKQNIELCEKERKRLWTPPCHTDDILYVRETWRIGKAHRYDADAHIEFKAGGKRTVLYFSHGCTDSIDREDYDGFIGKWGVGDKWHPSIHMPKEAARIFLRVTNVRVERLQDCGNMQAKDEGCSCCSQFARIWDSTIKKSDLDKYGWKSNPWVWVIEFEKLEETG